MVSSEFILCAWNRRHMLKIFFLCYLQAFGKMIVEIPSLVLRNNSILSLGTTKASLVPWKCLINLNSCMIDLKGLENISSVSNWMSLLLISGSLSMKI